MRIAETGPNAPPVCGILTLIGENGLLTTITTKW